jgi:hypothetical protein
MKPSGQEKTSKCLNHKEVFGLLGTSLDAMRSSNGGPASLEHISAARMNTSLLPFDGHKLCGMLCGQSLSCELCMADNIDSTWPCMLTGYQ